MTKFKRYGGLFLILAVAVSAFIISCSDDQDGLFYSLEIEEKAADNSLPNSVRASGDMIKVPAAAIDPLPPSDRYYVATGSVFYRDVAPPQSNWQKIRTPISGGIVTGIALAGGNIYVSVTTGSVHGLFMLDAAGEGYLPTNYYSANQITRLMSVNDELFAAVGTIRTGFDLLYLSGASMVSTGLSGYRILAGTHDGASYWFLSAAQIFTYGTAPGSWTQTPFPKTGGLDGKTRFTDIFLDPDALGNLYVCTSGGYIVKSTDSGLSWTSSIDHNRSFSSIAKVGGIIVLGVGGYGLYEMTDTNNIAAGIKQPGGNFGRLPDLNRSTVLRLLGDGTQLLAATSSVGVWRGDYSSSVISPVWSQE